MLGAFIPQPAGGNQNAAILLPILLPKLRLGDFISRTYMAENVAASVSKSGYTSFKFTVALLGEAFSLLMGARGRGVHGTGVRKYDVTVNP